MSRIIRQEIVVRYEYPVIFSRGVFVPSNLALADALRPGLEGHPQPRMAVYVENAVADATPALAGEIVRYFNEHLPELDLCGSPHVLVAGESLKSDQARIDQLIRQMADAQLDRHSMVMAIGGGALLDAVGFAASLIHRGVRMVRLPTTVLSQNDGGVGVKTAINDPAGKNFLGTFAPPYAVINDLDFLQTLPDDDWRGGIAEAFKVALIKDADFFQWLCDHAPALAARDEAAMEHLVVACAELHLTHIRTSGDPFEMGQARPLDFGHWSAHQLEAMTHYKLGHGAAVALGIMIDAFYAARAGWLDASDAERLFVGLRQSGFSLWHDALDRRDGAGRLELLNGLERFREHLGGRLCVTMPDGVGAAREIAWVDEGSIASVLMAMRNRPAPATS